jgi:hypothetical protein
MTPRDKLMELLYEYQDEVQFNNWFLDATGATDLLYIESVLEKENSMLQEIEEHCDKYGLGNPFFYVRN